MKRQKLKISTLKIKKNITLKIIVILQINTGTAIAYVI